MLPLQDKVALVTGASAGIGAATARTLAHAGARVVLAARREERLQALAEELPGASVLPLDIVLANAGLAIGTASIQAGDPAHWAQVIETNVLGVLHVVRAALPGMIERGSGDMLVLGSVAGRQVYPGGNVYNASKFAVNALYQAMRLDAAGTGVRFTTVDPGMVETEFSKVRFEGDENRARAVYEGMNPLMPEDVADAVLYAVTRPPHVNVGEIILWPTDQASTRDVKRGN